MASFFHIPSISLPYTFLISSISFVRERGIETYSRDMEEIRKRYVRDKQNAGNLHFEPLKKDHSSISRT
jgi:hypothetical protein